MPTAPEAFACEVATPSTARIEAAFKTEWLVYDGEGASAGGETLLDARVTLTLASSGRRQYEVSFGD